MRIAAVILIALLLTAPLCFAQETPPQPTYDDYRFCVSALAGYTPLPMMILNVDWDEYKSDQGRERVDSSDDSFLNPGPIAGISFTYFPAQRFIHLGFTTEAFYLTHMGQIKGSVGENREMREGYKYHLRTDIYQLNFLGSIYFTRNRFAPYVQFGLGASRTDVEIKSHHQSAYGATGIIAWGAQYMITDWFALGLQARTQDIFGSTWFYEPDAKTLLTIEEQIIPLSFLFHTNFYF